ncbi:MAG: RNA polymerase sigma factor [Patescibacteria group bacterium]
MNTHMGDVQLQRESAVDTNNVEANLVIDAQKGDEQAFGQIYDIWATKVYRFIYIKVKDAPTAEDITSEVFLKAWERIHQYRPQANAKFSTWLYTVARNTIIDHYRATKTTEISFDDLPEIADLEGDEIYQEATDLDKALTQLPAEYEKVLRLRFVDGHSISKVAQIVRKKEDNVRAITSRALKKLREILEG